MASISENEMVDLLKKQKSKKELRKYYAQRRVMSCKNTGTIVMKSGKDYDRRKGKKECRAYSADV